MLLQQHYNTGCWTKGTEKPAAASTALRKGVLSYVITGVGTKTAPRQATHLRRIFLSFTKEHWGQQCQTSSRATQVLPGQFVPKKKLDTYFMYLLKRNKVASVNLD